MIKNVPNEPKKLACLNFSIGIKKTANGVADPMKLLNLLRNSVCDLNHRI